MEHRGLSRIALWFAIAAITIAALVAVQESSPSVIDGSVEEHTLFDVELLNHTTGTTFATFNYVAVAFTGTLDSDQNDCERSRTITVFEGDKDDTLADAQVATGTSDSNSGAFAIPFTNETGDQTYYAVAPVKTYQQAGNDHTCSEAISSEITA